MSEQEPEVYRLDDDVGMVEGLAFGEINRQIALALRHSDCYQRKAAFYLLEVDRRRLYSILGCSSTARYAELRHSLERRRTGELISIARTLEALPLIDEAFCKKELSWSKVRLIRRLLTEENAEAWLEKAQALNCKALSRYVRLHQPGDFPKKPGEMKGTPEVRFSLRLQLDPDTQARFEASQAKYSAELGRPATALETLQATLGLHLELQSDGTVKGFERVPLSPYRIHVYPPPPGEGSDTKPDPESMSEDEAKTGVMENGLWVRTQDGLVPIDGVRSDGPEAPHRSDFVREDGEWVGRDGKKIDGKTSASMRRQVIRRDGHRCRCCGASLKIHVHHIEVRNKGGPTAPPNLVPVCTRCHTLAHNGFIEVRGEAGDAVFVDRDGRPLHGPGETVDTKVLVRMERAQRRGAKGEVTIEAPVVVELPREVDASWWRENAERIRSTRSGELSYDPTAPLRPDAADAEPALEPDETALDGILGRAEVVERVESDVEGSRAIGEPFAHGLFTGPAGTGKTTLARAIGRRLGAPVVRKNGPDLKDTAALLRLLAGLRNGSVLFLDEIHAAPTPVLEILYQAVDEGRLSLTFREGAIEKPLDLVLPPFTLIGATTHPGSLPQPLRTRLTFRVHLDQADEKALAQVARKVASSYGFLMSTDAARLLADRARGNARAAESLAKTAVRRAAGRRCKRIDSTFAQWVLRLDGYDRLGLGPLDRRVLEVLRDSTASGIGYERLAERAGTDTRSLLQDIEPELERLGLLRVTHEGRRITAQGRAHLASPFEGTPQHKPSEGCHTRGAQERDPPGLAARSEEVA